MMFYIFKRQALGLSLLTLMVFAGGCTMKPDAYFLVERDEVLLGELIEFRNHSQFADTYFWDFGDGVTSEETHTSHTFWETGSFTVTLTAISVKGNRSTHKIVIHVVETTLLTVVVRESADLNAIEGTKVSVYHTFSDWYNEIRPALEGITDSSGEIEFNFLGPYNYFISVSGAGYNNRKIGDNNSSQVVTPILNADIHTIFTAIVEPD